MPVDPGTYLLQIDTTTDRLNTPVWVDATAAFRGFSDSRRRTGRRFWDPYQSAEGTIHVRDSTDMFAPETIDRGKIRFSVDYGGAGPRALFTGTVWNVETVQVVDADTRIRRLTCYDAYADFNEAVVDASTQIDGGRMDEWIGGVLNRYGWPSTRRNLEPGRVTAPDFTGTGLISVSQLLRYAEQAEGGSLWIRRNGDVQFTNRNRLNALNAATPDAYFGDGRLPVSNIQIDRGSRNLLNQQTVQPAQPGLFTPVTVPDVATLSASQRRVGVKAGPVISNPLVPNRPAATSLAGFRVRLGTTPPQRASFVTRPEATDPGTDMPGFASIYGLDIGSVIHCNFPRQGFGGVDMAGNCYIEGMAMTFNRQRNSWQVRIDAVRTPTDLTFTLADANSPMDTNGILGTNTELGF